MTHTPLVHTSHPGERAGPERTTELQVILLAVARELTELGRMAGDLQVDLSPLAGSADVVGSLQSLDLLTQELHALAMFLDVLAPSLPAHWMGDAAGAADALTLSDLARKLGKPTIEGPRAHPAETGSLEMFETNTEMFETNTEMFEMTGV